MKFGLGFFVLSLLPVCLIGRLAGYMLYIPLLGWALYFFLIPMWPFIDGWSDPSAYQARFRELAADTGCHLHDALPDLWNYSAEERREFRLQVDTHLTFKGHKALARSLAPVVERIMRSAKQTT